MKAMKAVLYMPDGNQRFALKKGISIPEAYTMGGKTLRLLSEFFVAEGKADMLIYHALSDYSHERTDSTPDSIYNAAIKTLEDLKKENFFEKKRISFRAINNSGRLPPELKRVIRDLSKSTKNAEKGEVVVLTGYSLEEDINHALSQKPINYKSFREYLTFPDIDLVIRPGEMRPSGGPVYAMSQAQMIISNKLNPEVTRSDLERIWSDYCELREYRIHSHNNPHHSSPSA